MENIPHDRLPTKRNVARACEGLRHKPKPVPVVSQTLLGSLWGTVHSFLALQADWTLLEGGQMGKANKGPPAWTELNPTQPDSPNHQLSKY